MAKRKYYAVKTGRSSGIYSTWDECKAQTDGVSGAEYKAFFSLEEAEQYLRETDEGTSHILPETTINSTDLNAQAEDQISALSETEVVAFVDGSCNETGEKSAFGAIIFSQNGNKDILYKAFTRNNESEEFISFRNVAAELEGVKEVINWAIKYNKTKITIYYDYEGIEKWVTGQWTATKDLTKRYVSFCQEKRKILQIEFIKVPAHAGIKYNEEADFIARNALLAKGYKTYNDGSVYFVGYSVSDWKTIIECINEENAGLADEKTISSIIFTQETIGTREKIRVTQDRSLVVINCYRNSKSYVQGKQTVLFQKIIATAIALLESQQTVIETLNCYHALTIEENEVETQFEQVLPHYRHDSNFPKHYTNLLSAVYNTLLTGYMPDYTCLVTPIFRAYEYYLHRILGDLMGLDTETNTGKNYFSFFSKNSDGLYECNNRSKNLLSPQQLRYLNRLYTQYNSVRHPYSHWSASDIDTAVITDIATARVLLKDGLAIIDQYYILFK
ncbi:viroplasmin family protein [Megasphaera stantonii]|uniref:ribonuclease H1 domain-containing protein n=1 Tax=Megasphaera stantonii TaxID=2144175 RepID=UPI0023F1D55A|nr:viroplasmin family protein [Megasphaera stantonii]